MGWFASGLASATAVISGDDGLRNTEEAMEEAIAEANSSVDWVLVVNRRLYRVWCDKPSHDEDDRVPCTVPTNDELSVEEVMLCARRAREAVAVIRSSLPLLRSLRQTGGITSSPIRPGTNEGDCRLGMISGVANILKAMARLS